MPPPYTQISPGFPPSAASALFTLSPSVAPEHRFATMTLLPAEQAPKPSVVSDVGAVCASNSGQIANRTRMLTSADFMDNAYHNSGTRAKPACQAPALVDFRVAKWFHLAVLSAFHLSSENP